MRDSYLKDLFINEAKPALNKNQVVRQKGYDDGFDAGKQAEYDTFWDGLQQKGNRTMYPYGFMKWPDEAFYPKYDIRPTGWAGSIFANMTIVNLKQRLLDCGVIFDFSKASSGTGLFSDCLYNTAVPILDTTSAPDLSSDFYRNYALIEIEKLVLKNDGSQKFSNTFYTCYELQNLTIEGCIGQNGLNLQWSTKLTHDSLMSIINALKDYSEDTSGTDWVVTIGAENYAKLTADEIAIAENKGWRVE